MLETAELLRQHRKFVLTTHISSDGDGVGSQLALARTLRSLGAEVKIINPTRVPYNLKFLFKYPNEITTPGNRNNAINHFAGALTIVVDMGAFNRLGPILGYAEKSEGLLVIDHHRMERQPGVHYFIDEKACATGEIVARIVEELGVPFSAEIAEPLYVAIHTDTGGFRYPGTTGDTHRLLARLLDSGGVDPQEIYTSLYERLSLRRIHLTAEILATMEISKGGKVAWMVMKDSMLKKLNARIEDAEDMVNYTMKLDGVVAGFFFKELITGKTKVSCRSRGDFAVDDFVKPLGGGGHMHAAGVRLDEGLDEVVELIISKALAQLEGD